MQELQEPAGSSDPEPAAPERRAPSRILVGLARDGDEHAFEELVRTHQHRTYLIALRLTGNSHDAQDAVQEAFLDAWRGLAGFREDADFGTWLTRIVINSCHRLRRGQRPTEPLDDDTSSTDSAMVAVPGADVVVESKHHYRAAQGAIAELPFDQRSAFVLHTFAGHTHTEVGRILGITEGAAKVRTHRARRTIAVTLREWEGRS